MEINSLFGRNGNEKDKIIPILFDHQITSKKHYSLMTRTASEVVRGQSRLIIGTRQFFDLCSFVFCLTKKNGKGMEKVIKIFFQGMGMGINSFFKSRNEEWTHV